ncbi:hypothetical protein D3C81_1536250 [compost metagenome]
MLLEVVVYVGSSKAGYEVIGELVGSTTDVGAGQARCVCTVDAVLAHASLRAQRSQATQVDFQALDFFTGDDGAFSNFWQQAAVVSRENRAGNELTAVFQSGVGETELDCRAAFRLGIFRVAIAVAGKQTVTSTTCTAIKLGSTHYHGVQTYADGALSEAGLVGNQFADTGVLTIAALVAATWLGNVASTVTEVAVHVLDTSLGFQTLVFNKAFGFVLGGRDCELRGAC